MPVNADFIERMQDERMLKLLSVKDLKKKLEDEYHKTYPRFCCTKENLIQAILEAKYGPEIQATSSPEDARS